MAFIDYLSSEDVPQQDRVPDTDNILRVHSIHSRMIRLHYELYVETMHKPGSLTRVQREMIAVVVSSINRCHY